MHGESRHPGLSSSQQWYACRTGICAGIGLRCPEPSPKRLSQKRTQPLSTSQLPMLFCSPVAVGLCLIRRTASLEAPFLHSCQQPHGCSVSRLSNPRLRGLPGAIPGERHSSIWASPSAGRALSRGRDVVGGSVAAAHVASCPWPRRRERTIPRTARPRCILDSLVASDATADVHRAVAGLPDCLPDAICSPQHQGWLQVGWRLG